MFPQIVGPGTFTPSPLAPSAAERAVQGAQPAVGETAAASVRPEIANRVDPPRVIPAPVPVAGDRRRPDALFPPDPEAPAGPPPAFDATPLERAREAVFAPADLVARGALPATEGALPASGEGEESDEGQPQDRAGERRGSDTDAVLRERMESDVAALRRISGPEPDRAMDLTR